MKECDKSKVYLKSTICCLINHSVFKRFATEQNPNSIMSAPFRHL